MVRFAGEVSTQEIGVLFVCKNFCAKRAMFSLWILPFLVSGRIISLCGVLVALQDLKNTSLSILSAWRIMISRFSLALNVLARFCFFVEDLSGFCDVEVARDWVVLLVDWADILFPFWLDLVYLGAAYMLC